jgi:hypothetical protein
MNKTTGTQWQILTIESIYNLLNVIYYIGQLVSEIQWKRIQKKALRS